MSEETHKQGLFMIEENKAWYEVIAGYWGWIVAFFSACAIVWRVTRKTGETGLSIFKRVKSFTDTAQAIEALRVSVESGFAEMKAENEVKFSDLRRDHSLVVAKLEIMSDTFVSPQFRADCNGNFIDVNEAFCEFFHKTLDEIEGDGWTAIFARDDRKDSLDAWDRAVNRKVRFSQVFRVKAAGGEMRLVKMRARPVFDNQGVCKEFIGSFTPIERINRGGDPHSTDNPHTSAGGFYET